jgi:hypothetical protein
MSARKAKTKQCDVWRKTGAFQMGGTGNWQQCPNAATKRVHIAPKHLGDWQQNQACCDSCYNEFVKHFNRPHTVRAL